MLRLSETKDEISVVDDQIGSPTYTDDLAKLLLTMAETDKYGTYNATNTGYISWAEFAEKIFEVFERNTKVNKISTEEYFIQSRERRNGSLHRFDRLGQIDIN